MNMNWILKVFPGYEFLIEYDNIDQKGEKKEVHGLQERAGTRCLFCATPFEEWKKKDIAHAISECMGNKKLINYCECYHCNHRFGEIAENHLGKYILPYRFVNEVSGKSEKNVIKDMPTDNSKSFGTYRCEQKKNSPVFKSETFDVHGMIIETQKNILLTPTENGFRLTLPRQTYDPKMVYISLLKMAFTLLPLNKITHFIKNIISLYLFVSDKPIYSQTDVFDEDEKEKYINGLPHKGLEICLASNSISNGVNVCLLKNTQNIESKPELIFAIQMKWYTIVIPVLSDEQFSLKGFHLNYVNPDSSITIRELDFKCMEDTFLCEMSTVKIEIPPELIPELEDELRKANLLADEK